ncbi:efflux RND transporter periplasmic adaptor subunit [Mucilaginibacter limnophilus]|uniref:Efflux RND transporter periplasmic adaptor subunit n=1 Tax=Mucilaginibacter limnophilus TaxID=1932778 RepID=A0A3S2UM23_9SPHI|nr:efflux RND transporter periplasmic adaptor subunit [Mucilaginibacter limnophilus]RVU01041.1 efflux RND transporter periplasmic adaptor subunit [Mucilaginibacter limnophilus]
METLSKITHSIKQNLVLFISLAAMVLYSSCGTSNAGNGAGAPPPPELPVITVSAQPVTTYSEYTASLQGTRDIEIRPQVDGYLEAINVDEGAYVHKGQVLFRIDARPYAEQLNTANAILLSAKAALANADINVKKLTPLVQNNVISDVQLQQAKAAYDAAAANVAQAKAQVQSAKINLDYTRVTAPADGFIGKIPFKTGSLASKVQVEPLTVLSENKTVHAYFTMSEVDFIKFKETFAGNSIQEKISHMPAVELILADNAPHPLKGKVELAEGQFDKTNGTISFRATFDNANGLLRSGNTGKIRIPSISSSSLVVPQEATFEVQDKVFVYALTDSNKVVGTPLTVTGTSGRFYVVSKGIKSGDKIVYKGIDRLRDGMVIKPTVVPADSLLKTASL